MKDMKDGKPMKTMAESQHDPPPMKDIKENESQNDAQAMKTMAEHESQQHGPPPMKDMKATSTRPMSKTRLSRALAILTALTKSECTKFLDCLTGLAKSELQNAGRFEIPGVCLLMKRMKTATKTYKRSDPHGKKFIIKEHSVKPVVEVEVSLEFLGGLESYCPRNCGCLVCLTMTRLRAIDAQVENLD